MKLYKIDLKKQNRIFGLDLLRALAILIVVLEHGNQIVKNNFPDFPDFWIVDGVDLFFVLSGFLIGTILIKSFELNGINSNSILTFWKRRWFRTLPNYYLIIVLCLLYTFIKTKSFGDFSIEYLVFIQNFNKAHPIFLAVAWSLAIEEWFYFLFPIMIILIHVTIPKLTVKKITLIAIGIFLLVPLIYRTQKGLHFSMVENPNDIWDSFFRKTVLTRLDTIVFGVFGAFLNYYYSKFWNRFKSVKFLVGLVIIFYLVPHISTEMLQFTLYFDVLSIGILLLFPLLNNLKSANTFIAYPITYISLTSYSMYLIHYSLVLDPILTYVKPVSNSNVIWAYILYLTLTLLFSIIIYKFFEKPIMNLR